MSAGGDGSHEVWGLISTLVAGPAVWGAVGYGLDRLLGLAVLLPVGVVLGFVTSFYIVYMTQGRPVAPGRPRPGHPAGDRSTSRPDTGDDARS